MTASRHERQTAQLSLARRRDLGSRFDMKAVEPEGCMSQPRLYVVGEAPGAEEVAQGRPFVGPAGRALREMLNEAKVDLAQLRLANAIPFRPIDRRGGKRPRNRAPTAREVGEFRSLVLEDIRQAKPAVILALGSTAARLFGASGRIEKLRKRRLMFDGRPLRISYHPAFARRFGGREGEAWRQSVADIRSAWLASAR
jgi:uracil-DNA glycosylase family 4